MFSPANPPNPFHAAVWVREVPEPPARLVLRDDDAVTILRRNTSPDIDFTWGVNPYRGCTHACAYCYARRTHEYLDAGAGRDFERILFVKRHAARLLEEAFARPSWKGEEVCISGMSDAWQPIERTLRITRAVLEVCARHTNPVSVITRSPLLLRDLDLLKQLARHDAVRVQISLPLADPAHVRALEPGAPPPAARLRTIALLRGAGIPVGVSLAPVIPGLSDHAVVSTLEAAHAAGARTASMGLVRLPGSVRTVFEQRLRQSLPLRADAVLDRLRRVRQGMDASAFGQRHRGADASWRLTQRLFDMACERLGLDAPRPHRGRSPFRRPTPQMSLFDPVTR